MNANLEISCDACVGKREADCRELASEARIEVKLARSLGRLRLHADPSDPESADNLANAAVAGNVEKYITNMSELGCILTRAAIELKLFDDVNDV